MWRLSLDSRRQTDPLAPSINLSESYSTTTAWSRPCFGPGAARSSGGGRWHTATASGGRGAYRLTSRSTRPSDLPTPLLRMHWKKLRGEREKKSRYEFRLERIPRYRELRDQQQEERSDGHRSSFPGYRGVGGYGGGVGGHGVVPSPMEQSQRRGEFSSFGCGTCCCSASST